MKFMRDNGNGTATDQDTGLTWKQCAEGGTYIGGTCEFNNGKTTNFSWSLAVDQAAKTSFAGKNDWRLPTRSELEKIISSCLYKDKSGTDDYPGKRYADGSPQSLWVLDACENPSQRAEQRAYFGPPGLTVNPGGNLYCQERNSMPLLLVRSDTASPEFEQAKQRAAPALATEKQRSIETERKRVDALREQTQLQMEEDSYRRRTVNFRRVVKEGDDTTLGVVVEVKGSLVKVQTNESQCTQRDYRGACLNWMTTPAEKWLKKSEIYPPR